MHIHARFDGEKDHGIFLTPLDAKNTPTAAAPAAPLSPPRPMLFERMGRADR